MYSNNMLAKAIVNALTPEKMLADLIIYVLLLVAFWIIFKKAGEPGWKSIIPFYSNYIDFKLFYDGDGWKFLWGFVPIANIVMYIKLQFRRARSFGKSTGFGFGLLFLPVIFNPILAFSNCKYIGPNGVPVAAPSAPLNDNSASDEVFEAVPNNTPSTTPAQSNSSNAVVIVVLVIVAILLVIVLGITALRSTPKSSSSRGNRISQIDNEKKDKIKATPESTADSFDDNYDSSNYLDDDDSDDSSSTTSATSASYEDIYNEYLQKVDKTADEAVAEFKEKSSTMSDDEKSTLADSLTEKIYDVASDGRDKLLDASYNSNDNSEEYDEWSQKLNDHASDRAQEIYDIEYAD